jgi:hypothetical protein
MYPCLVPVRSASVGGEDAKDGVPMRWAVRGLDRLGPEGASLAGPRIVKKVS